MNFWPHGLWWKENFYKLVEERASGETGIKRRIIVAGARWADDRLSCSSSDKPRLFHVVSPANCRYIDQILLDFGLGQSWGPRLGEERAMLCNSCLSQHFLHKHHHCLSSAQTSGSVNTLRVWTIPRQSGGISVI